MMNIRQIRAFHATIISGSVTGAADTLGLTQPAVSKLLQNLEHSVGYKLFERLKGRINPTPEARFLFHEVDDMLRQMDRLDGLFNSTRQHQHRKIQIGSLSGPANFLLPEILGKIAQSDAKFGVNLYTHNSNIICDWISRQTLDIGLIDIHSASPSYNSITIPLSYYCAIPADDPLASRPHLTPKDLDGRTFISLNKRHQSFVKIDKAFKDEDATYNVAHEIHVHLPAISMVRARMGYAFIDTINAWSYEKHLNQSDISFIPFLPFTYEDMAIITPTLRPLSKPVLDLVKVIKSAIEEIEQQYQSKKHSSG